MLDNVVNWKTDCPESCHCFCRPNLTDFYIDVDCADRNLEEAPQTLPQKTNTLDLSHNSIREVPKPLLGNLTYLEHLLIHFNNLTAVPEVTDLKLKTLTLSNNKLTRFPVDRVEAQYLQTVSLSENPWICDCQTLPFVKWLLSEEDRIVDFNETKCGADNENFKLRKIATLTDSLLCPSLIIMYSIVGAVVAVILLSAAGGKILYNRYRMHIRVWMYSRGFSCVKEDDFDDDKQFDAFISYSGLDENFVLETLLPMLESGDEPYHVCIHFRNFMPGSYIQSNIMKAVKASKRTILVLSRNFLSSEWCRLEFKSAHHQVLEERLNRLIVVILGDLPPDDDIDSEILLYLQTTTYLRWGEKNFWNKLKFAMPKTPCDIKDEDAVFLLSDDD